MTESTQIRAYQVYLASERGLATGSLLVAVSAAEVRAEMGGLDTQLSVKSAGVRTRDCDPLTPGASAGMVGAVIATATLKVGILRLIR